MDGEEVSRTTYYRKRAHYLQLQVESSPGPSFEEPLPGPSNTIEQVHNYDNLQLQVESSPVPSLEEPLAGPSNTIEEVDNYDTDISDCSELDDTSDEDDGDLVDDFHFLRTWFIECKITRESGNALLVCLKKMDPNVIRNLPSDVRTILKNDGFVNISIAEMSPGAFVYFGVEQNLIHNPNMWDFKKDVLEMSINVDGLPIGKSTTKALWPILASIDGKIFMIAVYFGKNKPNDANEFLHSFVSEMMVLEKDGFNMNSKTYRIKIRNIICDLPAKSFLLNVVGHNGYNSCTRCTVHGQYIGHRMCFPEITAPPRHASSYSEAENPNFEKVFHKGPTILNQLDIDLVNDVVIDPMHAVYIGR